MIVVTQDRSEKPNKLVIVHGVGKAHAERAISLLKRKGILAYYEDESVKVHLLVGSIEDIAERIDDALHLSFEEPNA